MKFIFVVIVLLNVGWAFGHIKKTRTCFSRNGRF